MDGTEGFGADRSLASFDYTLPPERIAQTPAEPRDAARLLVLARASGALRDRHLRALPDLLRPGDLVVVNDTRVLPARLSGRLVPDGRHVEVLFLRAEGPRWWEVLARPARSLRPGTRVMLADGTVAATVIGTGEGGRRRLALDAPLSPGPLLAAHGQPPLPPYIERHRCPLPEDWARYQTVYAAHDGAIAAPTAGLHFTPGLLAALRARGVLVHSLTLHVGVGTFRPVRVADVSQHRVEAEWYAVPADTAAELAAARADGRRVVAVGTTTVRALESIASPGGALPSGSGWTGLTIVPGHAFRAVDGLLTNFHLPRSSLLLLVAAFAGRARVLEAYRYAVAQGYRFYSYGDAMLIL